MTFNVNRKDLVIPTKKQGAPRGKNTAAILRYAEQLKIVDVWHLPAILVHAITKPDKKTGGEKPTGKWAVLGGTQRVSAANEVKWNGDIPAEMFTGKELPDDRWAASSYVASIRDNMRHGQPFTEAEMKESFVTMREMKMTIDEIAREWHVHKSTVSRSLRGLTTTAAREANTATETETETKTETGNGAKGAQDVKHFLDFFESRFTEIYDYISAEGTDEKYSGLFLRMAENITNG